MAYISGNALTFENRLHSNCQNSSDFLLFQTEAANYTFQNIQSGKINDEFRKRLYNFSGFSTGDYLNSNLVIASYLNADVYIDFEAGNNGDIVTTGLLNSGTRGTGVSWVISASGQLYSYITGVEFPLHTSVFSSGTTYNDSGSSRSYAARLDSRSNYISFIPPKQYNNISAGFFFKSDGDGGQFQTIDYVQFNNLSGGFFVLQGQIANSIIRTRAHCETSGGSATGQNINLLTGVWYWASMNYGTGLRRTLNIYDTVNWSLSGTSFVDAYFQARANDIRFGRCDNHGGGQPPPSSFVLYDDFVVGTGSVFPFGP